MVEEYEIAIPHRRTRPQDVTRVVDVSQSDVDLPIPDAPGAERRGASPKLALIAPCPVSGVCWRLAYHNGGEFVGEHLWHGLMLDAFRNSLGIAFFEMVWCLCTRDDTDSPGGSVANTAVGSSRDMS